MKQDQFKEKTPQSLPQLDTRRIIKRRKKQRQHYSWFDGPYDTARGEQALWIAVITQAMMDALSHSKHPEHRYHKQAAFQWLTGSSKDFYLVCSLAGKDPAYVRRNAKKALVSPVSWRAAPGKGKRYQERKAYRQRLKEPAENSPPAPAKALILAGPWK